MLKGSLKYQKALSDTATKNEGPKAHIFRWFWPWNPLYLSSFEPGKPNQKSLRIMIAFFIVMEMIMFFNPFFMKRFLKFASNFILLQNAAIFSANIHTIFPR